MNSNPPRWDVAACVDAAPLGFTQILVVLLTFAVAASDGLDAQIIGFTAPQIAAEFGISRDQLGPVFSASLLGMAGGALLFGSLGDRLGRRYTMIACVAVFGFGTLLTPLARGVIDLTVLRLITGFGLGGALPNAVTLVAECAPARQRGLLVTLMYIGFSVGGMLGGAIASALVVEHGWRLMFYIGGLLPLGLCLVLWALLPESPHFLARQPGGRSRVSALLRRLDPSGDYAADHVYMVPAAVSTNTGMGELFRHRRARNTLLLWSAFFINLLVLFFLMNWLPTLLVERGWALDSAIRVMVVFNFGTVFGALLLAWLSARYNPRRMLAMCFALGGLAIMAIGLGNGQWAVVMTAGLATGVFAGAAQIGLYPITTQAYPSLVRATGVGWAQAWGRTGSILGPLAGGWLAVLEPRFVVYFVVFGAPLLVAAVAIAAMRDPSPATSTNALDQSDGP